MGNEQYIGRLSIPYETPTGYVDLRFRSLTSDDGAKYLSRAGAETTLFNVLAFQQDTDIIAICEGEFDTMIAHQAGIPAVGVPGANNWKDWWWRAFDDYSRVVVLCDGDTAGRDLGRKIAGQIDVAVVVTMPDGLDVNSFYMAEGADALRRKVGM